MNDSIYSQNSSFLRLCLIKTKFLLKKIFFKIKIQKLKFTEKPFLILKNRDRLKSGRKQKIPKNVYQTFSVNCFGKNHLNEIRKFQELNHDLNFIFFDDNARNKWMAQNWSDTKIYSIFKRLKYGPSCSDIFRYCLLFTLGGYYCDISKSCKVPLFSLHDSDSEALISFEENDHHMSTDKKIFNIIKEPTKYIIQWAFGFIPRHPFLKRVIKNIENDYELYSGRKFLNPKKAIVMFTGPGQFTKAVHQILVESNYKKFNQISIDFDQNACIFMRGSEARYIFASPYENEADSIIVS